VDQGREIERILDSLGNMTVKETNRNARDHILYLPSMDINDLFLVLQEPGRIKLPDHSQPSDYRDVQPKTYDPEFISQISSKMQVPDR
jgi:hypothetical protein